MATTSRAGGGGCTSFGNCTERVSSKPNERIKKKKKCMKIQKKQRIWFNKTLKETADNAKNCVVKILALTMGGLDKGGPRSTKMGVTTTVQVACSAKGRRKL